MCTENFTVSISARGIAATSETYFLTCTVKGVSSSPTIQWFGPDGDQITTSVSMETTMSNLTLFDLSLSDAGKYICQSTLSGVVREASKNVLVRSKTRHPQQLHG